ncbi:hypothetical protein K501DRAFT_326899 [Backusella circina FSU 941]|nr:hypothetical protein K501DRAFT_326899 [Backusella circina FSU 941]
MVYNSLLEAVAVCDKFPYVQDKSSSEEIHHAIPFKLGQSTVGNVLPSVMPQLAKYNSQFDAPPFSIKEGVCVSFSPWVDTRHKRTEVVKQLMDTWRAEGTFAVLGGWRNELYPVYGPDGIAFTMERAATPLFGVSTFGVHLNAYVTEADGTIKMWVAKRAPTKQTWPGYLDNCVAGGISYEYNIKETIIKECEEEASIPAHIAEKAQSIGSVTYYTYSSGGLQPETQYGFDLEMPAGFTPTPCDGEVECFYLWPLEKVKETILKGEWKANCAIVAIDFMMRHSFITPDEEPDYIDISYRCHRRLEFPTPKRQIVHE